MNIILFIFALAVIILLFFALCAFALQAARAALPKYEVPPTPYSYKIDQQHDDLERCIAAARDQHIWVINAPTYDNPGRQGGTPPLKP